MLVTALATLAIPAGMRLIVDRGFAAGGDPADIGRWFRYLLFIVAVLGVGTAVRFYYVSWLGERVVADIRRKVHANLLALAPAFFEENSPKEIASRMVADTAIIEQVVGTTVSVALRNAVMAVLGTIYLFWLAPQLTVWLAIAIPLVIVPIFLFARRLRDVSRTSQDRVADVGAMVSEVLGAMKIVQAFGQQRREGERFAVAVERTFDVARVRIRLRAIMTAAIITLIFGADRGAAVARCAAGGRGRAFGRHDPSLHPGERDRGGRVRRADRGLRRPAARRGRGQPAERAVGGTPRNRAARAPPGAARAAARQLRVSGVSLSPTRRGRRPPRWSISRSR